jgi:endonuclease-3
MTLEELIELPGVGRKTANVVLGVGYGIASGVVVDTHVKRLAQRLGFSCETTPERIEADLRRLFPREEWIALSNVLIFHGRRLCTARAPACDRCPARAKCPSAGQAELVGRKNRNVEKSREAGRGKTAIP